MITLLLILALVIAVIAVIFALQNTAAVSVSFFVWQFNQSLALVLLLAAFVGVIIGLLTILPGSIKTRWQLAARNKKIALLEKEIEELKQKLTSAEQRLQALQLTPPAEQNSSSPTPPQPQDSSG
ncbi:LapA family protein [Bellilinea sp.]|jgi:putative membrane protein|uniref:LapA family protein n=1 Tax=Bellilinea sp. TaxID=2838785 RepID=UPI002ADD4B19|nr:LapA family protein [Bellilinea sp.]